MMIKPCMAWQVKSVFIRVGYFVQAYLNVLISLNIQGLFSALWYQHTYMLWPSYKQPSSLSLSTAEVRDTKRSQLKITFSDECCDISNNNGDYLLYKFYPGNSRSHPGKHGKFPRPAYPIKFWYYGNYHHDWTVSLSWSYFLDWDSFFLLKRLLRNDIYLI